jgi:hypothetical protein
VQWLLQYVIHLGGKKLILQRFTSTNSPFLAFFCYTPLFSPPNSLFAFVLSNLSNLSCIWWANVSFWTVHYLEPSSVWGEGIDILYNSICCVLLQYSAARGIFGANSFTTICRPHKFQPKPYNYQRHFSPLQKNQKVQ